MAEISEEGGSKKKKGNKVRSKKMSTKQDFTPMVDLAFLLITFFMLTTTLNKPQTMEINMPEKDNVTDPTKIKESTAMTVILTDNDSMYYYFGIEEPEIFKTNFDPRKGVRSVLLDRNTRQIEQIKVLRNRLDAKQITEDEYKKEVGKVKSDKDALMVLIKSNEKARYKNLIDILDEMQITNIGKYAIVDLSPQEVEMISEWEMGGEI